MLLHCAASFLGCCRKAVELSSFSFQRLRWQEPAAVRLAEPSCTKGSICQSLLWCLGGLHCPCDKLSIVLKVYTVTDGKVVSGPVALVQPAE